MVVLLKAVGALTEANESINHIFYAEQHTNKHSLAHTIMTVTELLRNDENMKKFYRNHKPFKQLIIKLIEKYGAKSKYIRTDPGISYALNHLMRVLYIKSTSSCVVAKTTSTKSLKHKKDARLCSYPQCGNEETKYKSFKECKYCSSYAYCSRECRKLHSVEHMRVCDFKKNSNHDRLQQEDDNEVIYENAREQRRISDYVRRNTLQPQQCQQYAATMTYTQAKKLSKHTSNVEKQQQQHYQYKSESRYVKTKTTRSFKETKQSALSRRHSTDPSFNQDNQSIQFVRPLKTSTAVRLPDLKSNNKSSSSSSSSEQNKQSDKVSSNRRHSTNGSNQRTQEASNNTNKAYYNSKETEMFFYHDKQQMCEEDSEDDGESLDTSNSSLESTVSAASSKAQDEDEEEKKELFDFFKKHQKKQQKLIAEQDEIETERDAKLAHNHNHHHQHDMSDTDGDIDEQERRSQLKVMKEFEKTLNFVSNATTSINILPSNTSDDQLTPSLGLKAPQISLATLCYDNDSNKENDNTCDDTIQNETTLVKQDNNNKIVINNSVNSNLLLNSFASEVNPHKRVCHPINENDTEDEVEAKKFKKPLSSYLPLSIQPIVKRDSIKQQQQQQKQAKDMTINSTLSTTTANLDCFPIESTPIFDLSESTTNARRKNLAAQLDLNTTARNTGEVLMTLAKRQIKVKESKQITATSSLNLSQYAALTNAEATDSFIAIAKTELPKDLKKSLKDDAKREKKNCILQ